MEILVYIGVGLAVLGLCGLGYCIQQGLAIKRERPPEEVAQARLKNLVTVNFAAVALAALGLAAVAVGLIL